MFNPMGLILKDRKQNSKGLTVLKNLTYPVPNV